MRHRTAIKDGPLYDAARLLDAAARRVRRLADDAAGRQALTPAGRRRITSEAHANIDAALARMPGKDGRP